MMDRLPQMLKPISPLPLLFFDDRLLVPRSCIRSGPPESSELMKCHPVSHTCRMCQQQQSTHLEHPSVFYADSR